MKKTLLICATALLVASCSKDTTETPEVPEAKPQGITFSAAQDDDVRTKLDGVNILWQRGDAVGIFSEQIDGAVNYKAVITEEDHDKQFATLRTDLNYNGSGEHTFYAYYPYVEGQTGVGVVSGSISASQNGEIGSNAFMWATATVDPAANPPVDLHFKHPFTYLNIQLRATGEYQGATVEQIRIEAPEGRTLAGDFDAFLSDGFVYFTTQERVVTVTPAAAVLGADYLNTLVVVNAEDLTGSGLIVIVTLRQNGNVVKLQTAKAGRQLNPQTKVNLKLTAEDMDIEPSDDAIVFADDAVKAICVERWDTNGDGSLSYKEAAKVQSLDRAFANNANISSFDELQYFKGLTSISGEFSQCSNLKSIVIPDNVTTIEEGAFQNCSGLTSIVIPDNVTTLGNAVFDGCMKLTNVTIGNGIKTIPGYCFSGCAISNIVIPENVTLIGNGAFSGCTSLENIVIPENVTSIGEGAFYNCSSLTKIDLPDNLTSIGNGEFSNENGVFSNCSNLKSIVIPDKVTALGSNAFSGCKKLTDVTIGNGIETIPYGCFSYCTSLENIVISNNVTSIGSYAFTECVNLVDIVIPENVTSIGYETFLDCTGLESVTLPDKLSMVDDQAFSGCVNLKTFNGKYASEDHRCLIQNGELIAFAPASLKEYVIPESVTSIDEDAFMDCTELEKITIPDGVTEIKYSTFGGCTGIKSVTISKNVTMIDEYAFDDCPLTEVYCRALTPPTCGLNAFGKVTNTINLYVPTESVELYSKKATWKNFGQILGYNFGNL